MGTAIMHPVRDWVKPSFVIFDIQTLWIAVSIWQLATVATMRVKGLIIEFTD